MQDRVEIYRRVERQYIRDRLGDMGLQAVDGMVVGLLARAGQLRQEDMVHRLVLDKGAVARSVARLEELGLAERTVSDRCRREKLVSLTPAGQEAYGRIQRVLEEWNQICYQGFSPREREEYDSFLTRITQNVTRFKWDGMERGENVHG